MADLATFEQYYQLTDTLIEQSTKEQLAESVRLLALNIAHHEDTAWRNRARRNFCL